MSGSRERKRARADEAREIVAKLDTPAVLPMLSAREAEFVQSVERKLKRADYVSGKQLAWLRALQLRCWGVNEWTHATGES